MTSGRRCLGTCFLLLTLFLCIEGTLKTYYFPYNSGMPDYDRYNLYNDKIYVHTTTSVVLNTKGRNDCHVLLKRDMNDYSNNVIEISDGELYPANLRDTETRAARNRRHYFKKSSDKYHLKDNKLYKTKGVNSVQVVKKGEEGAVLEEAHGGKLGGHSGVNKTTDCIKIRYWWPGFTDDIKNFIKVCEECQKSDRLKPVQQPSLQHIQVKKPFELVGCDLMGPFHATERDHKYIFTATDYFTKWVEAYPIKAKTAAEVSTCLQKLLYRHGAVKAILTDQGREFVNKVNHNLCEEWNVSHRISAAYHPQTNGLDERTNQSIKRALSKYVNSSQDDWDVHLDSVLFSLRVKPQTTTKFSPFFLLYGREAVLPSQLPHELEAEDLPEPPTEEELRQYVATRTECDSQTEDVVKKNIIEAQARQSRNYENKQSKRPYVEIKEGEKVLKYNQRRADRKSKANLQKPYSGPFVVKEVVGQKCVRLMTLEGKVLKTLVSVDHVKHFQESATTGDQPTPEQTEETSGPEVYIKQLANDGSLYQLANFLEGMELPRANMANLQRLQNSCPKLTLAYQMERDHEEELEAFNGAILPYLRSRRWSLSQKRDVTVLMASVCLRARQCRESPLSMATTLLDKPPHLAPTKECVELQAHEKVFVGGEVLNSEDLNTLSGQNWVNDKVINAFLSAQKQKRNQGQPILILPSYLATLWLRGIFDHWLFTKFQFRQFQHILLPICHRDHWVLLDAQPRQGVVKVYDSLNQKNDSYYKMWRSFMEARREKCQEDLGRWTLGDGDSNQQQDGHSCGVFVMMNGEAILNKIPHQVMRQVHCATYRQYVREYLHEAGEASLPSCDYPQCTRPGASDMRCDCCGRSFHKRCAGEVTGDSFICIFCYTMYC